MRRVVIALVVTAGTIVPTLAATVWLFGCCILPFHRVMHGIAPLCRMAQGSNDRSDPTTTAPTPKQSSQRMDPELTQRVLFSAASRSSSTIVSSTPAAHRSYIALGAVRCDRDVGLHTILATFII